MRFGTSGLRGLVSEMTDPVCAAHAAAFLAHLRREAPVAMVLVGRDLRPSSPRIAAACRGAIAAGGATAVDCGSLPTPALALEAIRLGCPAIMVTGSHIPFDRNGLKFFTGTGEITKADEAGILAARPTPAGGRGGETRDDGAASRYVDRYVGFFGRSLQGMRVGVFEHSAAGRDLLVRVLADTGAEVIAFGRTDTFLAIDTEAVDPGDAAAIAAWVATHRLDALVSTDGDGDRPLVADEAGRVLRGDALGILAARALGAGAVAAPVTVSTALERCGWFRRVARCRIGSPYVVEAMAALTPAALAVGFEANGGFIVGSEATRHRRRLPALPTRDAALPIMAVLALAVDLGLPLSELSRLLPSRATASGRLPDIPAEVAGQLLSALATTPAARGRLLNGMTPVADIDTRDGVRFVLDSGEIVHLRASGNAPELRCYVEATSAEAAEALVGDMLARTAQALADRSAR